VFLFELVTFIAIWLSSKGEYTMGWLDAIGVGLDIANIAISSSNAERLEELRRQGAAMALIQAIVKELRDQIFNFKQTAEVILANESKSPKITAGAMKVLELRLQQSGIAPDLFQELGDKEYTASAIRLIRDNSSRLVGQLSLEEQTEVHRMASAASRLPDYNFYLSVYKDAKRLEEAQQIVAQYGGRNSCLMKIIGILIIWPGFFTPLLCGSMFGEDGAGFGLLLGFGIWLAALVGYARWIGIGKYGSANKTVNELKGKIDLERFMELDKEFGGESKVRELQQQAQSLAQNFFGESQLLPG
jgi:hypothetical protein